MRADKTNRPFALQLEVEFLDRLSEPVRDGRAKSVSEIIRTALERYDFSNVVVVRPAQLLISVRLPAAIRQTLKQTARTRHTSVGQLVRAAVEAYLPQLEGVDPAQMEMPVPNVELPLPGTDVEPAPAPARPVRVRPAARKKSRPKQTVRERPRPVASVAKPRAKGRGKRPVREPRRRGTRN